MIAVSDLSEGENMKLFLKGLGVVTALAFATTAQSANINAVAYGTLTGTEIVTFDDLTGGTAPGTNYDGTIVSGGVSFGEHFAGQTNTPSGNFDILTGAPTVPLAVVAGDANMNLNIFDYSGTNVLTGLGPIGFPSFDAIGEGSIAALFSTDQSQFGFQLVGGDGGSATIDFFARNGSLIDEIVVSGLADAYYGFSRDGGVQDIAGISIFNTDPGGIGFDNLKHDVASTVPEPGTLALAGLALIFVSGSRRRQG
jgi:PEP-CTERM motif